MAQFWVAVDIKLSQFLKSEEFWVTVAIILKFWPRNFIFLRSFVPQFGNSGVKKLQPKTRFWISEQFWVALLLKWEQFWVAVCHKRGSVLSLILDLFLVFYPG